MPKTELCIVGDNDKFICNDPRMPNPDYELEHPSETINYICTNVNDFATMKKYALNLTKELKACNRRK